ncbi:S8 family peptidase [Methanosarcina mazei]|uniref:Peptidase S8/S53 domain-containing protein n=1 Tax=Methanosarcina mazei TaxID=2209 RepID=A0A0F8H042_METMZ|nr:S8 family peptidase [Methanosarcina mazei]KKG70997.1 hypothetical protein DU63_05830 [Methanosarcina mazei]
MVEIFDHLDLQRIPDEFLRRKREVKFGYSRGGRNKEDFSRTILQSFEDLQQVHENDKNRYQGFIDPKLIFKLNVNQRVLEESFNSDLRRSGIEVISPSPDNMGYWIVFANDEIRESFEDRLRKYVQEDKYKFFDAIDALELIPPEEKIGESLKKKPFSEDELSYLDVEIWRMEDSELTTFLLQLTKMINSKYGSVEDKLTTTSFCLLRVFTNYNLYLDILNLREVSHVDRPPKFKLEVSLTPDIEDLVVDDEPPENACGILVIDSGIRSNHPLLRNAVGHAIAIPRISNPGISDDDPSDEVGHGTEVAGIAAYGDLQECLENKTFKPETWVFSAKVMFRDEDGYAIYDEKELLAHQLEKAVREIVNNHQNCKVINLSIGDPSKRMTEGKRQFNLASLIDSLAKELSLIFVVSAGNIGDIPIDAEIPESYPDYLMDETTDYFKITDPASSALAISVGAVSKCRISARQDVYDDYPSYETRVGMGYKGMIKPEFVENGGGGFGEESNVITTNWNWISEGRLFTLVSGTSYSTPKVSNQLARLINKYPHKSANFIKALLLSSSYIPENRPDPLSEINFKSSESKFRELLKIYGYGKPNLEKALYSESNRVLLINEGKIKLNHFHVYQIFIPEDFLEKGDKTLSVTLVFDPPTNKNRIEYFGANFETHLFKNFAVQEIIDSYSAVDIGTEVEDIVPKKLRGKDIKLKPGTSVRRKGVHQKGIVKYPGKPDFDTDKPLVLVVICQDKWVKNPDYLQDYVVIVSVEHTSRIDLYNQIRLRNRERLSITLKK